MEKPKVCLKSQPILKIRRSRSFAFSRGGRPMSSLVETINNALAAVGPATESNLRDLLASFGELGLGDEDRLSALATVIANAAMTHHRRHKPVYLEAVKTWAL